MKDSGINKACRYIIFRDKDILLNNIVSSIIVLVFIFLNYKGFFRNRGESFVVLMLYVLVFGLTQINANSMVVNMTIKDKLTKRLEFVLASDVSVKTLIKAYSIEIWRISSIIPFFLFYLTYVIFDFGKNTKWIVTIYLSTILMLFFEILYLNIVSLYKKNYKFFKNIVFFGTTILIYMIGTFSGKILSLLEKYYLNLIYIILVINIGLALVFAICSMKDLSKMNNESVINKEGSWS
ncbi:beta-carotene 15,15'-monooxygenase [Anaerococcus porci]|uniref:beta-carotene 15,15'-monooxygenase n=1 Tax=Anaerococcus porci TaxID=2652269 RepID=UPI002A765E69|nr:beta-carotene 15,15'-monooxygenase [Anaerococcus porci]MDY3006696.1 beta-carotene 15,15'-monooxygenase [Anaerococcus porci]